MRTLANQVVLITGASAGIGRQLAIELARERAMLVLAARREDRLREVASRCGELGAQTLVLPTDVTALDQCRQMIDAALQRFGGLNVLVNNAGRAMWTRFDEVRNPRIFEDLMRVNYLGAVYATYFALPHLKANRGQIVAMSSVSGMTGVPLLSGYSASKHAVVGFFESLRIELRSSGVKVTLVAPDFVQSEILERAMDGRGQGIGTSPLDQRSLMSTERCAKRIVRAIKRRERLTLMSLRSGALRWGKLLAPGVVDWFVERAVTHERKHLG